LVPQELLRHVKREFAKLLNLLQAYAVIGIGVRLICTNQVGQQKASCVNSHHSANL
jgi:DNA mismatch repair protein PMS2